MFGSKYDLMPVLTGRQRLIFRQRASEEKKSSTQWSCVYNQQDAGVEIAMNMDYEKVYTFGL